MPFVLFFLKEIFPAPPSSSIFEILKEEVIENYDRAILQIEVLDKDQFEAGKKLYLPARVVVIASDGSKVDGSGRGLYEDGRFYTNGKFIVEIPPGDTDVLINCGPNFIPLQFNLKVKGGNKLLICALMKCWFSPQARGWFCGDNHLHTRHDPSGDIKVDEFYTALQARAEGLDYITEADGLWRFVDKLTTSDFLFRAAQEIHTGVFTGHCNTPGIKEPIPWEEVGKIYKQVLPIPSLCEIVHQLGGIVIYTHTSPLPRLHWMGATESLSDAVLGKCADAFDVSNRTEELVWFTILNLGNKVPVSGSTDAVLLRRYTVPPGAGRIYAKSEKLDYQDIVQAIRKGRTFATNGGPLFTLFSIEGKEPGDTIEINQSKSYSGTLEIHHLYPLKSVEIIRNGNAFSSWSDFPPEETASFINFEIKESDNAWYVARVEDTRGNWAITSPIYFSQPRHKRPSATLIAMEIGNFTRMVELRRDFFIHIIVTTSQGKLRKISLFRDGAMIKEFLPKEGNYMPSGKIPVTEPDGEYSEGWIWYPEPDSAVHFQADYPIKKEGWYKVRVETEKVVVDSEEIHYDASNINSHQLSFLLLESERINLRLRGYGEEMPLSDIKLPFEGDHWWYPQKVFWEIEAIYDGLKHSYCGGYEEAKAKFK